MTEDGYGKGLAPAIFCCGAGTVRSDQWNPSTVIPRPHDQPGYFCTIPRHKVTFRKKMQKFLVLKKKIHIFVANYV